MAKSYKISNTYFTLEFPGTLNFRGHYTKLTFILEMLIIKYCTPGVLIKLNARLVKLSVKCLTSQMHQRFS